MSFQISQLRKEYLETARSLFCAAQIMTDRAIAFHLKSLADEYERRAKKVSQIVAAKPSAGSAATTECE